MNSDVLKKLFSFRTAFIVLLSWLLIRHAQTTLENLKKEGTYFPSSKLMNAEYSSVTVPAGENGAWAALFWSIHCGPCRVEMELIQKSINSGLLPAERIYAIHIGGEVDSVQAHMTKNGFTFPFLVDTRGELATRLDVALTPSLFLVDADRNIRLATSGLGVTHVFRMASHLK